MNELIKELLQPFRAVLIASKTDSLFLTAFSMQSKRLADFKSRLRQAVFEVIEEFQDDDGDAVREVFLVNTNQL